MYEMLYLPTPLLAVLIVQLVHTLETKKNRTHITLVLFSFRPKKKGNSRNSLAYAFSALTIVYVGNTVIHLPLFYIVFVLSSFFLYHQTHTLTHTKKGEYIYILYIIVICIAKHISSIPNSLSLSLCSLFKYTIVEYTYKNYMCMFIHRKYTKVSYMAHTKIKYYKEKKESRGKKRSL